ncbi:Crp/Fnr family transcriptional regulator [candidate division KSB1 bacterium]
MDTLRKYIADIFLFSSLSEKQRQKVADFCVIEKVRKGSHLFYDEDDAAAFYYIISGKVKVYKLSAQGGEQILEIREDGSLVAEAAIFDLGTYPAHCQTLVDTEFVRIPRNEFIELIEHQPDIALGIMHSYSQRLRYFVSLVEKLSLQDIKSRLAQYLFDHAREVKGETVFTFDLSKKELASLLGTIPETLSRAFRALKDEGLVHETKDNIVIPSVQKLKKVF